MIGYQLLPGEKWRAECDVCGTFIVADSLAEGIPAWPGARQGVRPVTILAPTRTLNQVGSILGWDTQWTTYDLAPAHVWITRAAAQRMPGFLGRPGALDSRFAWDNWRWMLAGAMGEAAYCLHYGLHLESILENAGLSDFQHHGRYVDVKTSTGDTPWFTVKVNAIDRMADHVGLDKWVIVGAQANIPGARATLMGTRPATCLLDDYKVHSAEDGHQYDYIRIPFRDLTPLREAA